MRHKFLVLTVKRLKSVYIYGSYRKIKTGVSLFGVFLDHPVSQWRRPYSVNDTPRPAITGNFKCGARELRGIVINRARLTCTWNLKSVALPSPDSWDRPNTDWSFGWGCEPQSWGRGGCRGSEMVLFEIVTFPLSLRVSELLPIVFHHATFPPHL